MKINTIKTAGDGNNRGFTLTGRVVDIIKHDGKDALLLEKLSGKNPGLQFIAVQRIDPGYEGKGWDEEGLSSLKIKKKGIVSITEAKYISSPAKEGEAESTPVLEARRVTRIGKDYRPDQSLVVSSYGASIMNLSGYIITPKLGVHADVTASPMESLKSMTLAALDKLGSNQGLMLVINEKSDSGNLTLHRQISRFNKENGKEAVLLSADEFKAKVEGFFTNPNASMINFEGTKSVDINKGIEFEKGSVVSAAIVPSEKIALTGGKLLDKKERKTAITGIGITGIGIDPATEDRAFPVIQSATMEVVGVLRSRKQSPENKNVFIGPKVVEQNDPFKRLVAQIDMLNGVEFKQDSKAAAQPSKEPEAAADADDHEESESFESNFDDEDPFGEAM